MFDPKRTRDIQSLVTQWGSAPVSKLVDIIGPNSRFGYIGTEDRMMYPLILPGAIVQFDPRRTRILRGPWRTQMERPIYFFETREGFACCWCSVQDDHIILQPHPLSPEPVRILQRQEVDVRGQVVAVAMRLDSFSGLPLPDVGP